MKTQTIHVTLRCNQRCGFCDQVDPGAVDRPRNDISAEIAACVARGVRELVLTGGEPLVRSDLVEIVRFAREAGAASVVLETNATLIADVDVARRLKDAGVTRVRTSVVTANPQTHRRVVGTATHPAQVFRGLAACVGAGLDVEVRLPIAGDDVPNAAGRLLGVVESVRGIREFVLAPIGAGERTLRPGQCASSTQVAEEIGDAWDAARKADVRLSLSAEHVVPPCVTELPPRTRRLLAPFLSQDEGAPNDACSACGTCALASRCRLTASQVQRAAGATTPCPVADATPYLRPGRSPGSRLRVLDERDVETFFHVDYEFGVDVSEPTSRIGVVYRCNQVCTFCELADMDVDLSAEKIRAALDAARARGSRRVILTGGEPTLSPDLVEHVRYAASIGFDRVEIQTNAVLLDRPGAASALRAAGLTHAQISLHGPDGAISDRLTAAPGTHARTLRGIDALLSEGVRCLINHLIFRDNCHLLEEFVDLAATRWGEHRDRLVIQFHSARNEFPSRDEAREHIARYRDYAPALRRAIDRGRGLGLNIHDLQDPTGVPSLCVLEADERYLGPIVSQSTRPRVHEWERSWMARVPACEHCEVRNACLGVPSYYVALHGAEEFAAIHRDGTRVEVGMSASSAEASDEVAPRRRDRAESLEGAE